MTMSKSLVEVLKDAGFTYASTDGQWVIYEAQGSNYNEQILCAIDAQTGYITIDRQVSDSDETQLWININQNDPVVEVILTHLTR